MRCIIFLCLLLVLCQRTQSACIHAGQCPVIRFHCDIACLPETAQEQCANNPLCCTKDSQCPRHQKCCQPSCGCYNSCVNATIVTN